MEKGSARLLAVLIIAIAIQAAVAAALAFCDVSKEAWAALTAVGTAATSASAVSYARLLKQVLRNRERSAE